MSRLSKDGDKSVASPWCVAVLIVGDRKSCRALSNANLSLTRENSAVLYSQLALNDAAVSHLCIMVERERGWRSIECLECVRLSVCLSQYVRVNCERATLKQHTVQLLLQSLITCTCSPLKSTGCHVVCYLLFGVCDVPACVPWHIKRVSWKFHKPLISCVGNIFNSDNFLRMFYIQMLYSWTKLRPSEWTGSFSGRHLRTLYVRVHSQNLKPFHWSVHIPTVSSSFVRMHYWICCYSHRLS